MDSSFNSSSRLRCLICGSGEASLLGALHHVPRLTGSVFTSCDEALNASSSSLELMSCDQCGFAWNAAPVAAPPSSARQLHGNASNSAPLRNHIVATSEFIARHLPDNMLINLLSVGLALQELFATSLTQQLRGRLASIEIFDPAWTAGLRPVSTRVLVHKHDFLSALVQNVKTKPNLIICRQAIEYYDDPSAALFELRNIAQDEAFLFVETLSTETSFRQNRIGDFPCERRGYFDHTSLHALMREAGWLQQRTQTTFQNRYLQAWGVGALPSDVGDFGEMRSRQRARPKDVFDPMIAAWRNRLRLARAAGRVAIWGAGVEGTMLAAQADAALLECAIDVDPCKWETYLPLSGLKVLSPAAASALDIRTILVVDAACHDEVCEVARDRGIDASIEVLEM